MTEYKDEIIKKAEEEKAGLQAAIDHAQEAIKDRNHLNYLDNLNIKRWEKAAKDADKTINAMKK
jgi:hypothetical protein